MEGQIGLCTIGAVDDEEDVGRGIVHSLHGADGCAIGVVEGETCQGLPSAQFGSLLAVLGQRGFGVIDAGSYDAARGGLVVNVFKLEDGCLVPVSEWPFRHF